MRKALLSLFVLALSILACVRIEPNTVVITATFLPPSATPSAAGVPPAGTPAAARTTPAPVNPATSQVYIVQSGDTLSGIATANGVSVDSLLAINSIPDPNNLTVGQEIKLPAPPTQEGSDFKLLPDSRLVRAPGSSGFDVASFVNQQPGYLRIASDTIEEQTYAGAQIVQRVALEYSVDPRLLLALLEFKSHFLSNPNPSDDEKNFAVGAPAYANGVARSGLYLQLAWAADQLNEGYYGWQEGSVSSTEFADGNRILFARGLNSGTVGVQYLLSLTSDYPTWQQQVSQNGFYQTYVHYFGDPFAGALDPVVPDDLQQPTLVLPFPQGQTWYFTGGPHGGWGEGGAWAALDFAPPDDITTKTSSCYVSDYFGTAVAAGIIARTAEGTVILDLDGDSDESTGWTILYLHIAAQDRVQVGTAVQPGDHIGHPSCEGGFSNGTHMHIARRYNGEWIPVSCDNCHRPQFVLGGWYAYGLPDQLYQGYLLKGQQKVVADQGRNVTDNQISW